MSTAAAPTSPEPAPVSRDPVGLSLLLPLRPGAGDPPLGRHLHAGMLRLLQEMDPEIAAVLHRDPGPSGRPWALSAPFRCAGRWWFRLSAIGPSAPAWLCGALRPAPLTPTGWSLAQQSGWRWRLADERDLAPVPAPPEPESVATSFLSPTALSPHRGPGSDPMPTPSRVLESLRGRAASHAGGAIAAAARDVGAERLRQWSAVHVRTTGFELRCVPHPTVRAGRGSKMLPGAVGWTLTELGGPPGPERALASALHGAAIYLGVGRKLSFGMGQAVGVFGHRGDGRPPVMRWQELFDVHQAWT